MYKYKYVCDIHYIFYVWSCMVSCMIFYSIKHQNTWHDTLLWAHRVAELYWKVLVVESPLFPSMTLFSFGAFLTQTYSNGLSPRLIIIKGTILCTCISLIKGLKMLWWGLTKTYMYVPGIKQWTGEHKVGCFLYYWSVLTEHLFKSITITSVWC